MAGREFNRSASDKPGPTPTVDWLAHAVIGLAIKVHRVLGPGLLESIYEEALCVELELARIPFQRQVPVEIYYASRNIGTARLDLLVRRQLIVELKAVENIAAVHIAQVLSYLRFTDMSLGLLINFHVRELRHGIKRVVLTPSNVSLQPK